MYSVSKLSTQSLPSRAIPHDAAFMSASLIDIMAFALSFAITFCILKIFLSFGLAVRAVSWNEVKPSVKAKTEKKASHIADRIKSRGIKPGISFKGRILFTAMSIVNRKGGMNLADSEYWKAKGWTDKKRPWKI